MQTWQEFLESKVNQQQHDALAELMASWLRDNDFLVQAGHGLPGFPPTKELPRTKRKPDVFAVSLSGGGTVIGEAETSRGLNDPETGRQMQDLQAESAHLKARLFLIVPRSAEQQAKQRLAEWGVKVEEVLSVPDELLPPAPVHG